MGWLWNSRYLVLLVSLASILSGCSRYLTSSLIEPSTTVVADSNATLGTYGLPKGLIRISGTPKDNSSFEIKIEPLIVPDGSAKYQIKHDSSWFADDTVQVTTTQSGLLKTVWSNVEDRTDEILIDVARAIGAVQGYTVPPGRATKLPGAGAPFNLIVDPNNPQTKPDWIQLVDLSSSQGTPAVTAPKVPTDCSQGLCSRPLKPWLVRILEADGRPNDEVVYLPDENSTFVIPMNRATMGAKQFYVSFQNGIISQVYIHEPSSAEALAELPINILNALLTVPKDMLKLRMEYSNNSAALAKAEMTRIQEEAKYRNYLLGLKKSAGQDISPEGAYVPQISEGSEAPASNQPTPNLPNYGPKPPSMESPSMEEDQTKSQR